MELSHINRKKKYIKSNKRQLEQELHQAFIELLIEKENYLSITISDITRKNNIRRATFYDYYASKEVLFKAIMEKECEELLKCFYVENRQEKYTKQQVEHIIAQLFTYLANDKTIFHFIGKDIGMPNPIAEVFHQFSCYYTIKESDNIEKGRLSAYYASGVIVSLILFRLHDAVELSPTDAAQQLMQLFEH
ncbi:MAG: TetR/AcrR family transcriptional regulator [Bacillus sp. (in: firmicutes)]